MEPFEPAPSVVVAYPSFGDWMRLYKPLKSRTEQWNREMYADFKRRHERTTAAQLQRISRSLTGAAVLSEMNARPTYSVMIFPFDFLPKGDWRVGTGAVTRATERLAEWSVGVPLCGSSSTGKHYCTENDSGEILTGTGTGSSVDIYFTASRHEGDVEGPDEVLLHELVHATRKIRGVIYRMPVSGGYGNQEEFLATLVANMYRSEKGLKQFFDYGGRPINPGKFLDAHMIPSVHSVLGLMRFKQPSLFSALAGLPPARVPFNPIRQVEAEHNALMKKIEQM